MGSEFVDWKSTLSFVIPAQAGIQVFLGLAALAKMDAGLRRHDKSTLRLKASDFNVPERYIHRAVAAAPSRATAAAVTRGDWSKVHAMFFIGVIAYLK